MRYDQDKLREAMGEALRDMDMQPAQISDAVFHMTDWLEDLEEWTLFCEKPESLHTLLYDDLAELKAAREKLDEIIIDWINGLSENDIDDYLAYNNVAGKPQRKPVESLISPLFLHQIHHRGQATTLISQSGVDFGETDILEIIDDRFT